MSDQRPASASAVRSPSSHDNATTVSPESIPLDAQFDSAVRVIRNLPKDGPYVPSHELQLKFYSYFKQATEGPCSGNRPRLWEPVKRAKWDAWSALGQMSREDAMRAYIKELLSIVETMSFTDNVAEFLAALGPLVHFVKLEKVVGEDAARKYAGCDPVKPILGEVVECVQPVGSLAPSVSSHKSSSEAFFSQDELGLSGDDEVEDGWSTPALEDTSDDESNENNRIDGNDELLTSTSCPIVRSKPKAKRMSGRQQLPNSSTRVQPCSCKAIVERMQRDLMELTERVKLAESTLQRQQQNVAPAGSKQEVAVRMGDHPPEAFAGKKTPWSLVLFKLRLAFKACMKMCNAKPNYAVVVIWPLMLQFAVLWVIRFYYLKF